MTPRGKAGAGRAEAFGPASADALSVPSPPPASGARPDLEALRHRVAAIAGTRVLRLDAPSGPSEPQDRHGAPPLREGSGAGPGAAGLAETLLGDGLTEIHADETRGGGSAAGFVLALAARLGACARRPVLWIAQGFALGESGRLYGPGLSAFGFDPDGLVGVETARLEDAVWAAEEAARSSAIACAVLEVRGNPRKLSLDGTRRLHVRARETGVPLVLLRQGAVCEPTAAPLRLRVEAGPAAGLPALGPEGERLIGHPVFCVAVEKSRNGRARRLLLEWNPHDRRFQAVDPRPLSGLALSPSADRPHPAGEAGAVVAFRRAS